MEVCGQLHSPAAFTPGEKASGTHWVGGLVGPRTGLNDVERRKILPLPGLEIRRLGRPAPWPVAIPTHLSLNKYSFFPLQGTLIMSYYRQAAPLPKSSRFCYSCEGVIKNIKHMLTLEFIAHFNNLMIWTRSKNGLGDPI
jgi:hypothetical protein